MSPKTLAPLALLLALLLALAVLPACTQTSESAKVEKSGKGKATLHTVVDKKMTEGFVMMLQSMGYAGAGVDPTAHLDPERIKKRLANADGIQVLSATRTEDAEKGTIDVTVEIAFDSLEKLYTSGALLGVGAKLEKLDDGNYRFTRSFLAENLPQAGNVEGEQMFEGMIMMMEPYLKGLEFTASLEVPTKVIETSGEKVSDTQVRWKIGFTDLPKAAKRTQSVVFSGAGLDWKPFEAKAANVLKQLAESAAPTGPITPSDDEPGDEPDDEPDEGGGGE